MYGLAAIVSKSDAPFALLTQQEIMIDKLLFILEIL
jgi:hypothetical protein